MKTTFKAWLKTKQGKRAVWAAAAIVVYALVGFFLLPWILGKVIPKKAGEFLDREVTIEKIRINPFVLSGSFQGLLIKDKDGSTFLSWDEVYGNFQLSSIFHWAFTFKEVRIVNPYVHAQINPDYSFNFSDILEGLESNADSSTSTTEEGIPDLRVSTIVISNAVAEYSDLTLREPFHRKVGPIDLTLKKFYTHPDNESPYSLEGTTEAMEHFEWTGQFFLFPLRSEGDLKIENVSLPSYEPLYQDFVSLKLNEGVIDLSGSYRLKLDGTNNDLSVSNVTFHLASLKVSADVDTTQNTLAVDDLKVSGIEADLWKRTARIGAIDVNGGGLVVRRNKDASINLVEMTKPSVTNAKPAGGVLFAMQAATNLISTFLDTTNQAVAIVDNLNVGNWTLQLEDDVNTRPVRLHLDDITVHGKNLSNLPGEDLSLDVGCRWNTNGTVKVDVEAKLFPIHSDVHVKIDRIELPPLDPYVEPFASVLLLDSKFSMDGVVEIRRQDMEAPFDVDFKGSLSLDDFSSVDGLMGTDLLAWKSVALDDITANLHPMEVSVGKVTVRDAQARLVVETNRTINVLNAMNVGDSNAPVTVPKLSKKSKPKSEPDPQDSGSAESASAFPLPPVTISSVVISNATVDMMDYSTDPALRWSVTEVNGDIGSLSSTNLQRADLHFTAKAGGTAPVEITGKLNPLNSAVDTDVTIKLSGMDLLPFSPYAGRYAGYQLRKGSLELNLTYHVKGRKLDSENVIMVDQLTLGRKVKSDEATHLPVKLGVAVLKDRNGLIELDVPIEGNMDDPEFRLGRVIGHTIMITLTKMFTSPFSLLGGLVGGSAEELSTFPFDPGSARLQLSATNGLQKLAKALYERPALEVEIQGSVSPQSDGQAIKKQKLNRRLQQLRWDELRASAQAETRPEDIVLSPDIRTTLLRKYYVEVFPDEARSSRPPPGLEETFYERMTDKLLEQIPVTDEDYRRLAGERAETVKNWLIQQGGVEPGRLFFTEGESPVVREGSLVQLQLQ